jgi:hypothetical protein
MIHEITLEYTEALLRQAALAFWRRTVGTGLFVALAIIACGLVWLVWHGDRSWLVGAAGGLLVFGFGIAFAVYFVHLRNSLAKFRAMGVPQAELTLDETSFKMPLSSEARRCRGQLYLRFGGTKISGCCCSPRHNL